MSPHTYYTYMMASSSRTLYIGVTNHLERRVQQHKEGTLGGFTAKYRCHRLVWFERYTWIGQAIAREKELKGWLRAKKIAPDSGNQPYMGRLERRMGNAYSLTKAIKQILPLHCVQCQDDNLYSLYFWTNYHCQVVILNEAQRSGGSAFPGIHYPSAARTHTLHNI